MAQDSPADPQSIAAGFARPRFKFNVPVLAREFPGDPESIVMQAITVGEEAQAMKTATATGEQFAYVALKYSIVSADGKAIAWAEGAKERFIEGCSPKVRTLLLNAFHSIHVPPEGMTADFLASKIAIV